MKPIAELRGSTVLVLGDVMLDEYVWGEAQRISPEAPSRSWRSIPGRTYPEERPTSPPG